MKISKLFGLVLISALFVSCSNAQEESAPTNQEENQTSETQVYLVNKAEFEKAMEKEGIQLVDVRTPGEVAVAY